MKLSHRAVPAEKKTLNPLLQTPEAIESAPVSETRLPMATYHRHIKGALPNLRTQPRPVNTVNPNYSEEDRLNLCPTLNFYQAPPESDLSQTAQIHLDNVRHNLQRRIQAAQAAGNETLVTLLETEYQQLSVN